MKLDRQLPLSKLGIPYPAQVKQPIQQPSCLGQRKQELFVQEKKLKERLDADLKDKDKLLTSLKKKEKKIYVLLIILIGMKLFLSIC